MAEGQQIEPLPAEPGTPTTSKGTDTTLAVGLSSFIVFLANRIGHQWVREVLTFAAPSIGVAVTYLVSIGVKQFYHWRGNKQLKNWITELVVERSKASAARRAVIDAELTDYRLRLKQRRLDNLP
jgi:hypothetical protein